MKNFHDTYKLTDSNIDKIAELVVGYLQKEKYNDDLIIRERLFIETILLNWYDKAPENSEIALTIGKRFGRININLQLPGALIETDVEREDDFYQLMFNNISVVYNCSYSHNTNIVDIKIPPKPIGNIGKIFIAIILALIIGNIMNVVLPADVNKLISDSYIKPLFKTIIGVLSTFASWMIFFSIISSITTMDNVATLKNIGSKYFNQVMFGTALTGVFSAIVGVFTFNILSMDNSSGSNVIHKIYSLLIDVIPTNIVGAFYKGNMLQIVFISLFIGMILLMLGKEVNDVNKQILQLNKIFQNAVRIICTIMPLFIFLSFLRMIIGNSLQTALQAWKIIVLHNVCYLLILLGVTLQTCIYCKIPFFSHLKNCIPLIGMGFSTASSMPCLPLSEKLLQSYNVKQSLIDFALPIGVIISRRTKVCYYVILVIGLSAMFGKTLTISQLIMLVTSSLLLSYATPSIPGGGLAIITLLLEQYGLPLEAIGVAISFNFLDGMPSIAVKAACTADDVLILNKSLEEK